MTEDFYDVLGVSRDADEDEIKRAYREKATEYHPDVSDDPDAEEKFKKIQKAHEVLTDEQKRAAYDRMGHERFEQAEKHGGFEDGAGGRAGGAAGGSPFGEGGPFGGNVGDIFEQFFGGGGRSRQRKGSDLKTTLELDLEAVYEGTTKQMTVTRPGRCGTCGGTGHPPDADRRTCPECNGRGQVTSVQQTPLGRVQQTRTCRQCGGDGQIYSDTCSTCAGEGRIEEETTLSVDVPAGIQDGQTLRMEGEGAAGPDGAPSGDLLIEISIRDHPDFERDGEDLHYQQLITFPQAVFGDTVEVPTLDGSVEFEVPEGTQSGETFRIEGKGMPHLRRRGHGDLYVQVQVVTPESLNDEQREALEAFAEASGEEIEVERDFFDRIRNSL